MTVADRFTGQVALITGGARGIGAATAARLAAEGADVVIADFDLAAAEETAAAIGGRAVQCDVTSREQVEATVAAAAAPGGLRPACRSAHRRCRSGIRRATRQFVKPKGFRRSAAGMEWRGSSG